MNDGYLIADCPAYAALFAGIEVKAKHPITVLNPDEWFVPKYVLFDTGHRYPHREHERISVRGDNTCWFNLAQCTVRRAS